MRQWRCRGLPAGVGTQLRQSRQRPADLAADRRQGTRRTGRQRAPNTGADAPYTGMTVGVPKNSTGRGATVGYRWAFD